MPRRRSRSWSGSYGRGAQRAPFIYVLTQAPSRESRTHEWRIPAFQSLIEARALAACSSAGVAGAGETILLEESQRALIHWRTQFRIFFVGSNDVIAVVQWRNDHRIDVAQSTLRHVRGRFEERFRITPRRRSPSTRRYARKSSEFLSAMRQLRRRRSSTALSIEISRLDVAREPLALNLAG